MVILALGRGLNPSYASGFQPVRRKKRACAVRARRARHDLPAAPANLCMRRPPRRRTNYPRAIKRTGRERHAALARIDRHARGARGRNAGLCGARGAHRGRHAPSGGRGAPRAGHGQMVPPRAHRGGGAQLRGRHGRAGAPAQGRGPRVGLLLHRPLRRPGDRRAAVRAQPSRAGAGGKPGAAVLAGGAQALRQRVPRAPRRQGRAARCGGRAADAGRGGKEAYP